MVTRNGTLPDGYVLRRIRLAARTSTIAQAALATFLIYLAVSMLLFNTDALAIVAGPLLIVAAWLILRAFKAFGVFRDPMRHAPLEAVAAYGGVEEAVIAINREVSAPGAATYAELTLTPNWLIEATWFVFRPRHLHDVIWLYPKDTTTYINGIIPAGTAATAVVHFRDGSTIDSMVEDIAAYLSELSRRAPWAIVGYQDKIADLARTPSGFATVVSMVDHRRREGHS